MATIGADGDDLEACLDLFRRWRKEKALGKENDLPAAGTAIGITEASRKYGVPDPTIWRWVERGLIPIVRPGVGRGPGSATMIDERELARVAAAYLENPGRGKRTAILSA